MVGTTSERLRRSHCLSEWVNQSLDFGTDPANAYYTVRAAALDKAGNYSAPLSHTFVFDGDPRPRQLRPLQESTQEKPSRWLPS